MKYKSIAIIIFIYLIFSISTLSLWGGKDINTITGDEPHYLIMASGIVKYGSLEQTAPYKDEFNTKEIFKSELAPQGAEPSPKNTHAFAGPHGLFNVHNVGLPLLLSLPFLIGGMLGAKLFMIFCGALVIHLSWKFASMFSENKTHGFWAVIATTISLPLIPASNQIYPDILAGYISLIGLYWFITAKIKRSKFEDILLISSIVFLPWLQIKFLATSTLLAIAISVKIYLDSKDVKRVTRILLISSISFIALALYNFYAFGKISGPYASGALELSKTSLMVLLGLVVDQNQGFLIENPVNLIGLLAIGWIYRINRPFALIWGLVFLSLLVPNALHPNWYGGDTFSGRFGWAASVVFIIPTIYGLLIIGNKREKIFFSVIALGILLQLYFFCQYAIFSANLYNKNPATFFNSYSIFFFPAHSWLPMLYNSEWAFGYMPNYAWVVVVFFLLATGFKGSGNIFRKTPCSVYFIATIIFTSGLHIPQEARKIVFQANDLPSQTGSIAGHERIAEQGKDNPGFLNYGPYYWLRKGKYQIVLTYSSSALITKTVGSFGILNSTTVVPITDHLLHGTNNTNQELIINFQVDQWLVNQYEFRTYWNGLENLRINNILLKEI